MQSTILSELLELKEKKEGASLGRIHRVICLINESLKKSTSPLKTFSQILIAFQKYHRASYLFTNTFTGWLSKFFSFSLLLS